VWAVALVDDEVDDLEHGAQARRELGRRREFEAGVMLSEALLGAGDPLGDGRLGLQEGAGDLADGEAAHQPERQRHLGVAVQARVAAQHHQP